MVSKNISRLGIFGLLIIILLLVSGCNASTSTLAPDSQPAHAIIPTPNTTTAVTTTLANTVTTPTTTVAATTSNPTPAQISAATTTNSASNPASSTATLVSASVSTPTTVPTTAGQTDWLQFGFNAQHSGYNPNEKVVSAANVGQLHKLFEVKLPDTADGAPVYLAGRNENRSMVFVTTRSGDIVAVDAHTGQQIWKKQNPAGSCKINLGSDACYTTSSAVLDPNRQYVYSYGLDGRVHKYKVSDGTEITGNGWPQLITAKDYNEKGSSALTMATASDGTSYLYMASAGYPGDRGDYQGHITTINLATGAQHVFNANCSNRVDIHFVETPGVPDCKQVQTAIWPRPSAVYDAELNRIYMATGNGDFNPSNFDWGDTVFALNPNGTGKQNGNPLDSYTPDDYKNLQDTDADLGSTDVAILPVPDKSKYKYLGVQGGKDEQLRLLNLQNLNNQSKIGATGGEIAIYKVPQGGGVFATPAVWVNPADNTIYLFITTSAGISAMQVTVDGTGTPGLKTVWQDSKGGTSPIIANGVLYYVNSGRIAALNPTTGKTLWEDSTPSSIHWESPILVNGVLYVTDGNSRLLAYALPS